MAKAQKTVGVLDQKGFLIGQKKVAAHLPGPVDPGDLPHDASYKWDETRGSYIPLGAGFGKVKTREPYEPNFVMARMIEAMGNTAPPEAVEWLNWYNETLRQRHEELAARPR